MPETRTASGIVHAIGVFIQLLSRWATERDARCAQPDAYEYESASEYNSYLRFFSSVRPNPHIKKVP
jgi:hypothetical protein